MAVFFCQNLRKRKMPLERENRKERTKEKSKDKVTPERQRRMYILNPYNIIIYIKGIIFNYI